MFTRGKFIEIETGGWKWGLIITGYEGSYHEDENVLKLIYDNGFTIC